jgi:hypothetical protein
MFPSHGPTLALLIGSIHWVRILWSADRTPSRSSTHRAVRAIAANETAGASLDQVAAGAAERAASHAASAPLPTRRARRYARRR